MKKTLIITLSLIVSLCSAQQEVYQKVNAFVKQSNPELITSNKLMVINFSNDKSNETNAVFDDLEKTARVYGNAKLKGGKNGVLCVLVANDSEEEIALNKKGYKNLHVINKSVLGNIDVANIGNITFDSNGKIVFKNLETTKVYEAINQLITR